MDLRASLRRRDGWLDPETRQGRLLGAAVVAVIAGWGVARAALVGITHDEALTLLIHVPGSWGDVFAHRLYIGSNNHLLNTVFLKLLAGVLPPFAWVIRLPALAGLAMYLAGCWRLLRRLVSGPRFALGLALMGANPFVLDLQTVARGYGLGLGLLALAASAVLDAHEAASGRGRAFAQGVAACLAMLAVAANLSMAYPAVALGVLAIAGAARGRRRGEKVLGLLAAAASWSLGALASAALYRPSVLANIGYYVAEWGGERGFWADTMRSLAAVSLYRPEWAEIAPVLAAVFGLILGAGTVLAAVLVARRGACHALAGGVLFCWLVAAAMAAGRLAFGTRWPLDRSAVVLLPALGLVLVGVWETLAGAGSHPARLGASVAAMLVAVLVTGSVASWNLRRTHLWAMDAATPTVMRSVAAATRECERGSVRMVVSWRLEPAVNFYRVSRAVDALAPVRREQVRPGFDFYYLQGADRDAVRLLGLAVCRQFPDAQTLLAVPAGRACPPS
ncbi:MAG TPA: hypothetical protein P5234_09225 [Thermoanaerobaculaceae bacterium]|nr:hypothetical protein [Thermoanaerobaculaceae bacterium]HRS16412.1 hypothetical protein [Thermoanaerobaculaceae bacterium]